MWEKKIEKPKTKTPERALETLRWVCSKMERSLFDARMSLRRWGVDPSEWDAILESLLADKYIDLGRYARAFVREKVSAGGWGERKIRFALSRKDIPKAIIDEAMQEYFSPDQAKDQLFELLTRRFESERKKSDDLYKIKTKLYRWAASRGYESEQITNTLERIIRNNDEQD